MMNPMMNPMMMNPMVAAFFAPTAIELTKETEFKIFGEAQVKTEYLQSSHA